MTPKPSASSRPIKPDLPEACARTTKAGAVSFDAAVGILRAWRQRCPNAVQLDGQLTDRNNLKPWLHFQLEGFSSPRHDFLAKHSQELIGGHFYNGTWNLHGDAKATAIDHLLKQCAAGLRPVDMLIPTATHEAKAEHHGDQNPKLILPGVSAADSLYLYQS